MRTELPYDPEGIDPDFAFGARCASLRPALELYAEGELSGTEEGRVVRDHLSICTECRDRLARHDAQTRAILEDGAFEEGSSLEAELRVARVLAGIEHALRSSCRSRIPAPSLSPLSAKPSAAVSAAISAATPAAISAAPRADFLRGFARLAAIVMISSGLGLLVAHEWAARGSDSPEAGARSSFAFLDSGRVEAEAALDAEAFRWIADRVPEGFPEASGPLSLRLRGPRVAEAEGRHAEDGRARVRAREWIIEGVVGGGRAAIGPRYFLVRVDSGASVRGPTGLPTRPAREGGAVEFRPSRCFAARLFEETAGPAPRLPTREDEEVGVFRVCIVEEVRAFETVVQVPDQVLEGAWLPWAPPPSRGHSRWVVPVGFDR